MSHFVIDPSTGQKYGPAGIDTLNRWVSEGRITPQTVLEDSVSGAQIAANLVAGLNFGLSAPPPAPEVQPNWSSKEDNEKYRQFKEAPAAQLPGSLPNQVPGQQEVNNAWIYLALGFAVCSVIFLPMSIIAANRAAAQGNDTARVARILAIVLIVLNILAIFVFLAVMGAAAGAAMST